MQALLLLLSEGLLAAEAPWAVETLRLQVKAHANPPSYRLCCRDSGSVLTGSESSSASLSVHCLSLCLWAFGKFYLVLSFSILMLFLKT